MKRKLRALSVLAITLSESLILAQDERWRHASYMQVERFLIEGLPSIKDSGGRVSNAWATCPKVGDNIPKGMLIPYKILILHEERKKGFGRFRMGPRPIS